MSKTITMRETILDILSNAKSSKISLSSIEKELGFANGFLGKIRSDESRGMSPDTFEKLKAFAEKNSLMSISLPKDFVETSSASAVAKDGKIIPIVPEISLEEKELARKKMAEISKKYNCDVSFLGDRDNLSYDVISTGSFSLDEAIGVGGLPRGRMVEMYGLESGGKTTICSHIMANAQKKGLRCMLIDAENAFDPEYAKSLGVNIDELQYSQPNFGEEAINVIDSSIDSDSVDVVIVDSVAALTPRAEIEAESGEMKMGLHARLMSQACRKLSTSVSKKNVLLIWINQIRNKIGVMYGSPEVTTGGMALQFYCSVRLDVRKGAVIKKGEEIVGHEVKVTVKKNKVGSPMKVANFNIMYGKGIDRNSEIFDIAVDKNIIEKSGSWFSYEGSKLGQGKFNVIEILDTNPDLMKEIETKVIEKLKK